MSMTVQSMSEILAVSTPVAQMSPAAPTNLAGTLQFGPVVNLTWTDNANNETGVVVERQAGAGAFAVLATVPADSVSFADSTAQPNTTYTYQVYAVNSAGASPLSNQVTIVVPQSPVAPNNLALTVQGALPPTGPRIAVTFRDNQNNTNPETGFEVFRSDNGGAFFLLATLPPRNATGTVGYFDYAVVGGNTYAYYVRAINASSASLPSNTATASLPAIPAAPANFSAIALVTGPTARINMSWIDNSNNETRFVIQRASDATFTTGLVTYNRPANSTTWAQTNLPRGTTFFYRIRAENTYGVSAWMTIQVTTP